MATLSETKTATATLAADTVDSVTLSSGASGLLEVTHHGDATQPIWVRLDGTNPAVAGADSDVVLSGQRVTVSAPASGEVRLISSGIPTYTVSALR